MRPVHEGIGAASALIQTIVGETGVTVAHRGLALLVASAKAMAIFFTPKISADRSFLTESIGVAVVALSTLGTVLTCKVRVAHANVAFIILKALLSAKLVALAARYAHVQVKAALNLWLKHGSQADTSTRCKLKSIASAFFEGVGSKAQHERIIRLEF